jgi:hypothetical protein
MAVALHRFVRTNFDFFFFAIPFPPVLDRAVWGLRTLLLTGFFAYFFYQVGVFLFFFFFGFGL